MSNLITDIPTKVVSLVAGPGAGKSTTAAGIFHQMKLAQTYKVELVTEIIKDAVYDENQGMLNDQLLLTATQNHALHRLVGKVDFVISDACLLNGIVYNRFYNTPSVLDNLILHLFREYDNTVVMLPRKAKYEGYGRSQTEEEAKQLDKIFIEVLNELGVVYHDLTDSQISTRDLPSHIVDIIGGI